MFSEKRHRGCCETAATLTLGNTIGLPSNPPVLCRSFLITGYHDDGMINTILIGPPAGKLLLIVKVSHLLASKT